MSVTFTDSTIEKYRKFLLKTYPGMNIEISPMGAIPLFDMGAGQGDPVWMLARIEGTVADLKNKYIAGSLFEEGCLDADILTKYSEDVALWRGSSKLVHTMGSIINYRYGVTDVTSPATLKIEQINEMFETPRNVVFYNIFQASGDTMSMRYFRDNIY